MELFSVLVTGANRGIGLEFVSQLANLNPPPKHIFATYRDTSSTQHLEAIKEAKKETTKIHLIQMDVTNEDEMKKAAEIVKNVVQDEGLTVLINNAGVAKFLPFPNITKSNLEFHLATNTFAPILLTQVFYPLLKRSAEKRGGQGMSFNRAGVLNISSLAGSITNAGVEFLQDLKVPSYKMSKAALNMGMRTIAAEIKQDNIIVIMMCPGWVKTDMGTKNAEITLQESISAMLKTLPNLNETRSGNYMNRFGDTIPF